MVIAFLMMNPCHHKYSRNMDNIGGEYNGYVAFDQELPPSWQGNFSSHGDDTLDGMVKVHGGITFDSEWDALKDCPIIPLTAIPSPEELKKFRCIGFDTLHYDDTRDKWPIENVKAETLELMHQIEKLIAERK